MIVCAIDPGQEGGVAVVERGPDGVFQIVDAIPMPLVQATKKPALDADRLAEFIEGFQVDVGVIERVGSMPKQGVASSFQFGRMFGSAEAVLMAFAPRLAYATPGVWKRAMGLSSSKIASLDLATQMFGRDARDEFWPPGPRGGKSANEGVAEAALLGAWYIQKNDGGRAR